MRAIGGPMSSGGGRTGGVDAPLPAPLLALVVALVAVFVAALVAATGGQIEQATVAGPLGERVVADIGVLPAGPTAAARWSVDWPQCEPTSYTTSPGRTWRSQRHSALSRFQT